MKLNGDDFQMEPLPASCLEIERARNLLRFVETRYSPETFERYLCERFPDAEVSLRPMTLREIFIVLARTSRVKEIPSLK